MDAVDCPVVGPVPLPPHWTAGSRSPQPHLFPVDLVMGAPWQSTMGGDARGCNNQKQMRAEPASLQPVADEVRSRRSAVPRDGGPAVRRSSISISRRASCIAPDAACTSPRRRIEGPRAAREPAGNGGDARRAEAPSLGRRHLRRFRSQPELLRLRRPDRAARRRAQPAVHRDAAAARLSLHR